MRKIYIDSVLELKNSDGVIFLEPRVTYIHNQPIQIIDLNINYLARKKKGRFNKKTYCLISNKDK